MKQNTRETMIKRKRVAALEQAIAEVPQAEKELEKLHLELVEYPSPFCIFDMQGEKN